MYVMGFTMEVMATGMGSSSFAGVVCDTRYMLHVTRHTSHVTCHTSHVTRSTCYIELKVIAQAVTVAAISAEHSAAAGKHQPTGKPVCMCTSIYVQRHGEIVDDRVIRKQSRVNHANMCERAGECNYVTAATSCEGTA
jgi:hypothetical protein